MLFLTSWFEGVRRGSLPIPGRPTGPILKILQDLLKRRYIPILTSNVGHVGGAHTPLVMAGLYMNQDLLAEHGMKLCTADTFGTNPKEHYHWIDSMAVVPTSWKELHRASR